MKRRLGIVLMFVAALGIALAAQAGDDVTMTGKIMCAKCSLKKADAKECQDVLVVTTADHAGEYYLVKNKVLETFGHVCQGEKSAVVTGKVEEKNGKKWLTAAKMEVAKS